MRYILDYITLDKQFETFSKLKKWRILLLVSVIIEVFIRYIL